MKVNATSVLLVLTLVLAVAFGAWIFLGAEPGSLALDEDAGQAGSGAVNLSVDAAMEPQSGEREQIETRASEGRVVPDNQGMVEGRLLDSFGEALGGMLVGTPGGEQAELVSSQADGRFKMPFAGAAMDLRVMEAGWSTLASGLVEAGSGAGRIEPLVIAAPAIDLAGIVKDEAGRTLAGVDLRFRLPRNFAVSFPSSLDASKLRDDSWQVRSDADGRFSLEAVAAVEGASLVAGKNNYLPAVQDLPVVSRDDLEFLLVMPDPSEDAVLGQVLNLAGYPVEGAQVCLGTSGSVTDAEGRFALSRRDSNQVQTIRAMKRGWLPAMASLPESRSGELTPFVYLRLAGPPLAIRGRILDARGSAVAGARVWALGPDQFPGTSGHVSHVEAFLAGGATTEELRQRFTVDGELTADMGDLRVQNPTSFWGWVETDARGRFDLGGLQRKDYRLRILLMKSLQMQDAGPFSAGAEGVEILFEPEVSQVIAGRVLGKDGMPIAGVSVQANCVPIRTRFEWPDGRSQSNSEPTHNGPIQRTDTDGRFRFEGLGANEIFLTLRGDHIMVDLLGLAEGGLQAAGAGPIDELRITVLRRMQLRVALSLPELADSFSVHDADNEPLQVVSYEGGGMASSRRWRLTEGRSPVLAVSEAARIVVLHRDGVVVREIPVSLVPGEVNVIDG